MLVNVTNKHCGEIYSRLFWSSYHLACAPMRMQYGATIGTCCAISRLHTFLFLPFDFVRVFKTISIIIVPAHPDFKYLDVPWQ